MAICAIHSSRTRACEGEGKWVGEGMGVWGVWLEGGEGDRRMGQEWEGGGQNHLRRGRPKLVRRHHLAARVDERRKLTLEALAPKGLRQPRQVQQQGMPHPPRWVAREAAHERLLLLQTDDVEEGAKVAHHRKAARGAWWRC